MLNRISFTGLAKLGNIAADANVSQFSCTRNNVLWKQILRLGSKEMFLNQVKNIFASETYVSQFSHPRKYVWKQCFRSNVS